MMQGYRLSGLCLLLSACATVSPVIDQGGFTGRLAKVEQIGRQTNIIKAIKQYQDYIAAEKTSFNRSFADYQKELQDQIQVVSRGSEAVPTVTGEGIAHLYEARLDALIQAYRGLAAAQIKQKDFAGAQDALIEANSLVQSRSISPVHLARDLSENYSLLKGIYAGQGKSGKALLADLNINLSQDYLNSPQGQKDARATKRALQDIQEILINVDFLIGDANARAKEEAAVRLNEIMGVVSSALNQYMASQRSFQSASAQVHMAQQINDVVMQAAKTYFEIDSPGETAGPRALNPLGSIVTTRQLVDPASGVNPRGIIKSFCTVAAQLTGDADVGQEAQAVSALIDGVMAVREKGRPEQTVAAVQKFGKAFTTLQGLVEQAGR